MSNIKQNSYMASHHRMRTMMLGKPDEEITQNMWPNAWEIQSSLAHKFGETSVGNPDVFFYRSQTEA